MSSLSAKAPSLVIWGTSGHALIVADIVRLCREHRLVGFLDDVNSSIHGTLLDGVPILGGREQLPELKKSGISNIILGFGACSMRLHLGKELEMSGFNLVRAIHPSAIVAASATIGAGTVVAAGAIVNPAARLGTHVIVNTGASVDHECTISDGVHLSPGVRLAGSVHVGEASWLGIGAVVKDKIRIGSGCVIGAGAVVLNDIPNNAIAYGCPARVIRLST